MGPARVVASSLQWRPPMRTLQSIVFMTLVSSCAATDDLAINSGDLATTSPWSPDAGVQPTQAATASCLTSTGRTCTAVSNGLGKGCTLAAIAPLENGLCFSDARFSTPVIHFYWSCGGKPVTELVGCTVQP